MRCCYDVLGGTWPIWKRHNNVVQGHKADDHRVRILHVPVKPKKTEVEDQHKFRAPVTINFLFDVQNIDLQRCSSPSTYTSQPVEPGSRIVVSFF
ncbi:thymine dioxygenase [Pseudozyma hubeiensis SY62]|uniref:Thymine dioxygenase n=1 Tax=Pseudozyma hubeiensis (strain SY62) TaxID=1305764 RepID=R9P2U4_PSEHS|nr:thymine dioxygenase [Pseudozyma hubeiensis SY62]GAC95661.1 thymine dioxygenase [Pseudozyma hubeiensis SY62]